MQAYVESGDVMACEKENAMSRMHEPNRASAPTLTCPSGGLRIQGQSVSDKFHAPLVVVAMHRPCGTRYISAMMLHSCGKSGIADDSAGYTRTASPNPSSLLPETTPSVLHLCKPAHYHHPDNVQTRRRYRKQRSGRKDGMEQKLLQIRKVPSFIHRSPFATC